MIPLPCTPVFSSCCSLKASPWIHGQPKGLASLLQSHFPPFAYSWCFLLVLLILQPMSATSWG